MWCVYMPCTHGSHDSAVPLCHTLHRTCRVLLFPAPQYWGCRSVWDHAQLYMGCGDLNSGCHAYSASSLSLRATLKPGKISLDSCLKPNINSFLWSCSFHEQLPALWGEPCVRQQRLLQAGSQGLVEMVTI